MPHVSVILPAFNAETTIERCLQSLLMQKGVEIEIIVIDDASSDQTAEKLARFSQESLQISVLRNPTNAGPSHSRNKGIELAKAPWIAFVDADDWIEPERLEKMLRHAEANNADIVFDNLNLVLREEKTDLFIKEKEATLLNFPWSVGFYALKNRPYESNLLLGFLKPFFRTAFLRDKLVRYDESLSRNEDYMLILESLTKGGRVSFLNEPLYNYTINEKSLSGTHNPKAHENAIKAESLFLDKHRKTLSKADQKGIEKHITALNRAAASYDLFAALRARDIPNFLRFLWFYRRDMPLHLLRLSRSAWRKVRKRTNRGT